MSATAESPRRLTVLDIARLYADGTRIPMLTAYDFPTARILDEAGIPLLLVGDSVGQVMLSARRSHSSYGISSILHTLRQCRSALSRRPQRASATASRPSSGNRCRYKAAFWFPVIRRITSMLISETPAGTNVELGLGASIRRRFQAARGFRRSDGGTTVEMFSRQSLPSIRLRVLAFRPHGTGPERNTPCQFGYPGMPVQSAVRLGSNTRCIPQEPQTG